MTKKQAMPYWKHYTSYSDDVDFLELDRSAQLRYWECYSLAWKCDAEGDILNPDTGKPLTTKQIAMLLRDDIAAVTSDLAALVTSDLLRQAGDTWQIVRYSDEQDSQAAIREAGRERKAKHDRKQKTTGKEEPDPAPIAENGNALLTRYEHVTAQQQNLTELNRTELELEKELEAELNLSQLNLNATEPDGQSERPAATAFNSNSSQEPKAQEPKPLEPFKPKNPEAVVRHAMTWKNAIGHEPNRATLTGIDELLEECKEAKMKPARVNKNIQDIILRVTGRDDVNDIDRYFLKSLQELRPQELTSQSYIFLDNLFQTVVNQICSENGKDECQNSEVWPRLNAALEEQNIRPLSKKQFDEFNTGRQKRLEADEE